MSERPETSTPTPQTIYRQRLERRRSELARWSRRELWVSVSRLLLIAAGLVAAWLSIQSGLFSPGWVLPPFVAFAVLVVVHERVLRSKGRAERAVDFYRRGELRLEHRWMGSGDRGDEHRVPHHPYAEDLDLFGEGSLYELLSVTRTKSGGRCLASWLLAPAALVEIRERQAAVADLRDRLDLRESLWTLGLEVRSELDPERLVAWAEAPARLHRWRWLRWVLLPLAFVNFTALVGWLGLGWGATPLLAWILVSSLVYLPLRRRVQDGIAGVDRASRDLVVVAELLYRLEREDFAAPWLCRRSEALLGEDRSAGDQIGRLRRLVDLLDSRRNPLFAPFAALMLWTTQLAFRIDAWRRDHGAEVVCWLEIVGELEALASLAAYAFERRQDPFPELVEPRAGPLLEGTGLGHPLIDPEVCVRNDLSLGGERRALVVSGSNMSGKSTFLRTCGVNVVLALAGAPVRASSLRLSPLAVGATIRVQDSLQEGASRFYAEIVRLRQLLDVTAGPLPLFFLLDEILHGTNSHDRRIGAEAVIRALLDGGALGLVTTHDLALSEMAKDRGTRMDNVHFEDEIGDGKVVFDYRLREGVVTRSNALALMREVGLDV